MYSMNSYIIHNSIKNNEMFSTPFFLTLEQSQMGQKKKQTNK